MQGDIPVEEFTPDATDLDPQSAVAAKGVRQLAGVAGDQLKSQWDAGGEQIHQALQGDPATNPQAREALENLSTGLAMSTVGGEKPTKIKLLNEGRPDEGMLEVVHPHSAETKATGSMLGGDYDYWLNQNPEIDTEHDLPYHNPASLETISVHPDMQGQGVGHHLYNEFEKQARAQGADAVFTNASPMGVGTSRRDASKLDDLIRFYKSLGFQEYGPKEESNQVMIKPLKRGKKKYSKGGFVSDYADGGMVAGDIPVDQFVPDSAATPEPGDIPVEQFTPDDYTTASQTALAGLEGASQGLIGDTATKALEVGSGLTTDAAIEARAQASPWVHGGAKGAAFLGSALLGTGEAALVGKAGEAIAHLAQVGDATTLGARTAAGAIRGATELGLLSSDNEVSKQILNDPGTASQVAMVDQPLSNVLANIGVGAVAGGFFGAAAPVTAKAGRWVAQEFENLKGMLGKDVSAEAVASELNTRVNTVQSAMRGAFGNDGLKFKSIQEAMPEMRPQMSESAHSLIQRSRAILSKNEGNPLYKDLAGKLTQFESKVLTPEVSAADQYLAKETALAQGAKPPEQTGYTTIDDPNAIYHAMDEFKQGVAEGASFDKNPYDVSVSEKPYVKDMKSLHSDIKTSLEDTKVWGKAGEIQSKVNRATSEMMDPMKLVHKSFSKYVIDPVSGQAVRQIDAGPIQTLINQADKPGGASKIANINSFMQSSRKFIDALNDAYGVEGDNLISAASTHALDHYTGTRTTGMKIGALMSKYGVAGLGNLAGGVLGGHLGAAFGPEGAYMGTYLGKETLGKTIGQMIPAIGKPLLEKLGLAPALRAASKYVSAVAAGNDIITKGARNVFKAGAEVLPLHAIPSITRLEKQLVAVQNNPGQFAQNITNNHLGYYMPNHAQAMGQQIANQVKYITALKPPTTPERPLDMARVPSSVQQAAYHDALRIAEQPATVLQKVKDGTITPDDIKHLTAMAPAAYTQMQQELSRAMVDHISKGGEVPYPMKVAMSLFLQQPMDSTLTPQAILSAQPPQVQQGGGGSPAPKKSGSLHAISDQAMTPEQARLKRDMKG